MRRVIQVSVLVAGLTIGSWFTKAPQDAQRSAPGCAASDLVAVRSASGSEGGD